MHLYDQMAKAFSNEGVTDCFALLGDANMNFATRLSETGCRMIYVRHEHCAAAAAMAYARKSGRVGVATVTCGPGLTQLMTALPAAVRARLPMVVLAGESPVSKAWYNQAIDQAPFVTATGAAYLPVHDASRVPAAIRNAFLQAKQERRPIVIGVPFDLQEQPWTGPKELPAPSDSLLPLAGPIPPNPDDLARATQRIEAADRIVLIAGLGAAESGAAPACRALAKKLDAPLATTLPARGLFHDDPFCLGIAGGFSPDIAREMLGQADLVIAVGASLASHMADAGKLWPKAEVMQIDTAPITVSQGRVAAQHHLRADARLGVEALTETVAARPTTLRTPDLAHRIATEPADGAHQPQHPGHHDPRDVVTALDVAIPKGWQLVNSSGHCSYYFAQMQGRPFDEFITIREFGAIGNGTSFAMGVSAAKPGQPVVLFDGDGSFLMHVQELETMLRHDLPILIVVLNDSAYGSEIHKLRAEGLSDEGAVFGRTDLASIALGFGAQAARINDLANLADRIEAFRENPCLTVLDIPISDRIMSPVIRRSHGISIG